MTGGTVAAAESLASAVVQQRLADSNFATHFRQRCRTWEVDHDAFLGQAESAALVALLATGDEAHVGAPDAWYAAAAAALRHQHDVELFAALPAPLPDSVQLRVDQLRLMSTGLTSQSAHRWARLTDTACEFLQPAAFLEPASQ